MREEVGAETPLLLRRARPRGEVQKPIPPPPPHPQPSSVTCPVCAFLRMWPVLRVELKLWRGDSLMWLSALRWRGLSEQKEGPGREESSEGRGGPLRRLGLRMRGKLQAFLFPSLGPLSVAAWAFFHSSPTPSPPATLCVGCG